MAKFAPPTRPFIPARHRGGSQTPRGIVIHGTVSPDNAGTARTIANWWHGPTSPVTSAHYVVDPREDIQCVGDHTVAYHCGFNTGTIAIELCDEQVGPASRWTDADSVAILHRAARLAAELSLAYGIEVSRPSVAELKAKGPHGIYGHNDSRLAFGHTTHSDPLDFPWDKFLGMVRAEVAALRGGLASPSAPAAAPAKPSKAKTFKVLHAPLHGVTATADDLAEALKRKGVVSVAFSEAYPDRVSAYLRKRPFWRTTTGGPRKDARGRAVERDVTILVRRYRKHLSGGVRKASNASEPFKIAPERFLAWTVDNVQGKPLATIALHPHASVKDAWGSPRAAEYRKAMRALVRLVRELRALYGADLDIVVLGDLNYPDIADGRTWAPRQVFKRLGLSFVNEGVDWVAYSKGLALVSKQIISRKANGQDHPWVEAELRRV